MTMTLKSTPDRYGMVAITIHWVSAALILILLITGFRAAGAEDAAGKAAWLRIHLPVAVLVLMLTLFRIVWWLAIDRKPDLIAGSPPSQERVARAVHLVLYIVVLGMFSSGVGMTLASGAAPIIFGAEGSALPDFWRYPPRVPHGLGARLLVSLLIFHVAAALFHHYVRNDRLLRRIWYAD
ncbi:cytochrome b [Rhodopseudomonas pseudopalustris]|uniref:Cytochrome B561 n=2 Tax=Rhodopseudomonas TaxID=1073 RepID=Q135C5_RHOPS|nr:cytochrome b/b6 domain-containing protein [Rhodopseudomonas pseudopalustris]ABE40314.1 cytochrome B561 [Rhodopseudomonas palustris BisB5]SEP10770.1 cytochrome b561 [Rhodopseudomonas pseudopalustris]